MAKPFFEVFPTLKIENPLHDKLEQAEIEKVTSSKLKDYLRIYLFSTRLILKEDIWKTEKEIQKQLFPGLCAEAGVCLYCCPGAGSSGHSFPDGSPEIEKAENSGCRTEGGRAECLS